MRYRANKGISIQKALKTIKIINDKLCIGDKKEIKYSMKLTDSKRINEIKNKYNIISNNALIKFHLKEPNQLSHIIGNSSLYDRMYLYTAAPGYSINLNTKSNKFTLKTLFSSPFDIGISKDELYQTLTYLKSKQLVYFSKTKIEDLVDHIVNIDYKKFDSEWSYTCELYGIKLSAKGECGQEGGRTGIRPTGVTLSLLENYYTRFRKTYDDALIQFYSTINECFSSTPPIVKVSIYCSFDSSIFGMLKTINCSQFEIPTEIKLDLTPNFSEQNIELEEDGYIRISNFEWLNQFGIGDYSYANSIALIFQANDQDNVKIELNLSKHIASEYIKTVEKIVGFDFDFVGTA